MTPFERGFLKQAAVHGVSEQAAYQLAKYGSGVGAYFASGPAQRGYALNSPYASMVGGGALVGVNQAAPGVGNLGTIPLEMLLARMSGGGEQERADSIKEHLGSLENEGYGSNAHRYGKTLAMPMAAVGALAGGVGGGYLGMQEDGKIGNGGSVSNRLLGALLGAGAGGLAGGASGYLGGGVQGLYDKFVTGHTSDESKERAKTFKTKHPYLTALPLGDVFGAAMSKDMKPGK